MQTNTEFKHTIVLTFSSNRLNIAQVNNIQKYLLPLVSKGNIRVILDLKNVSQMDCGTVNCLIALNRIAKINHTALHLRNLKGNVKLLAKTLKLSKILNIEFYNEHNNNKKNSQAFTKILKYAN